MDRCLQGAASLNATGNHGAALRETHRATAHADKRPAGGVRPAVSRASRGAAALKTRRVGDGEAEPAVAEVGHTPKVRIRGRHQRRPRWDGSGRSRRRDGWHGWCGRWQSHGRRRTQPIARAGPHAITHAALFGGGHGLAHAEHATRALETTIARSGAAVGRVGGIGTRAPRACTEAGRWSRGRAGWRSWWAWWW